MFPSLSAVLFALVVLGPFHHTNGFKWQTLKAGDPIPQNAVLLHDFHKSPPYIGRTKYFNSVQLAEVYNSTYGKILSYGNTVVKTQFEILVAEAKSCEWRSFSREKITSDQMVLGGTAWNGEPIYVGKEGWSNDPYRIVSIYLSSNKTEPPLSKNFHSYLYLSCNENHTWVDANSSKIPNNSFFVGNLNTKPIYLARLLGPSWYLPGYVTPSDNTTIVNYENLKIESFTNQVLLEDSNRYSWRYTRRNIPDYAVACGISKTNELMYIVKVNGVSNKVFSSPNPSGMLSFEILVRNV